MKIQLITGKDYKECFPNREAPISVIFEPTKTTIGGIAYLADFHFANLFGNSGCKDKRW
jgi:hypothetical protein